MLETPYLIRDKQLPQSQDYDALRKAGILHIQNLAHELWTDYNPHDPGITLLELMCYGITDLGYRTAYDLKDLLTTSDRGAPVAPRPFHTAQHIFPNAPVTFQDIQKVLVDIEGIRHAWVTAYECAPYNYQGLYQAFVEFEEYVDDLTLGWKNWDRDSGKYESSDVGQLCIQALRDIVLREVSVYADCPGDVVIRLLNAKEEELLTTTFSITDPHKKTPIPLNWLLYPQTDPDEDFYILDAKGSSVKLYMQINGIDEECPMDIENVLEILPGKRKSPTRWNYYYFYDITVDFPDPNSIAYPSSYQKKTRVGLRNNITNGYPGSYLLPGREIHSL